MDVAKRLLGTLIAKKSLAISVEDAERLGVTPEVATELDKKARKVGLALHRDEELGMYVIAPADVPAKFAVAAYRTIAAGYLSPLKEEAAEALWAEAVSSYFHVYDINAHVKAVIHELDKFPDKEVAEAAKEMAKELAGVEGEPRPERLHIAGPAYAHLLLAKAWGVELEKKTAAAKRGEAVRLLCVDGACIEETVKRERGKPYYKYYDFVWTEDLGDCWCYC